MKLKGKQIIFGNPKKADIVIFDEVNSKYVRKALNKDLGVVVFNTRPYDIFLSFHVLFFFIKFVFSDFTKSQNQIVGGYAITLIRNLKAIYVKACLYAFNPKAVVTMIDNDLVFHWLSKNCLDFPFIAIQNGSRLTYAAADTKGYYLQHFFCFGEHEKNQFKRIHYTVENFYPVGSLIASLHFVDPKTVVHQYDILVLSAWRGNIGFPKDVKDTMRSMRIMDELLEKYLQQKNLKAAIILRSERNGQHWFVPEIGSNEEDYFKSIYGNTAKIIETDFRKRNIFPLMQESRFIISCLTSALLEGFGIGKKALFCNFTGTDEYHLDFDPAIVTTDSSYENFSKQLDALLDMAQQDYDHEHRKLQQYYMHFPERKTTQKIIADTIDDIITRKQ